VHQDAVITPNPPLTFLLPEKLPVTRNADSGISQLAWAHNKTAGTCLYQGANNGTEYDVIGCVPAQQPATPVTAGIAILRVWSARFGKTTEVEVPIKDAACGN